MTGLSCFEACMALHVHVWLNNYEKMKPIYEILNHRVVRRMLLLLVSRRASSRDAAELPIDGR